MASISRRFITVEELEQQRRERLAAGKTAEDDTPYDPRSLFEQLQAQKDEKQRVWDEQHAFKNQVRGLNEEETLFLDECSQKQIAKEQEADLELKLLISASETRVLDSLTIPKISAKTTGNRREKQKIVSAQKASLQGAIKRRGMYLSRPAQMVKLSRLSPELCERKDPDTTQQKDIDMNEQKHPDTTEQRDPEISEQKHPDTTEHEDHEIHEQKHPDTTEHKDEVSEQKHPDTTEHEDDEMNDQKRPDTTEHKDEEMSDQKHPDTTGQGDLQVNDQKHPDTTEQKDFVDYGQNGSSRNALLLDYSDSDSESSSDELVI